MRDLTDYRAIVGDEVVYSIFQKARKLHNEHILHLNSTYQGGGVAEMLVSLIPLMNNAGIHAGWRIIHGHPDFFTITKSFHKALQGEDINLTDIKEFHYEQTNQDFSTFTHIDHDCVIIHDPQPMPLIKFYKKEQPWIWRCHIDLSNPNPVLWNYLKNFLLRYDIMIISTEDYKKPDLPVEQRVIHPAIDPLSPKNKKLSDDDIHKYLEKYEIPSDKPIITQVARFDKHKDPEGAIRVFKKVKEKVDCRLVLCGSMASDDPEGAEIFENIESIVGDLTENKDIILITIENDILVNVLQRASTVILQKSEKEGFGLTVSESLWKEKPVVASKVGGIPLQIEDGKSGYLLNPDDEDGFADRIVELIKNPELRSTLGTNGKKLIKEKFLITRLLCDYLDLLNDIL